MVRMGRFRATRPPGVRLPVDVLRDRPVDQVKDAIGKQPALFAEPLGASSDADLRAEFEMFGRKASRGSWFGSVWC